MERVTFVGIKNHLLKKHSSTLQPTESKEFTKILFLNVGPKINYGLGLYPILLGQNSFAGSHFGLRPQNDVFYLFPHVSEIALFNVL